MILSEVDFIVQMRTLILKDTKCLAQGHRVKRWWRQNLNLGILVPKFVGSCLVWYIASNQCVLLILFTCSRWHCYMSSFHSFVILLRDLIWFQMFPTFWMFPNFHLWHYSIYEACLHMPLNTSQSKFLAYILQCSLYPILNGIISHSGDQARKSRMFLINSLPITLTYIRLP